MYPRADTGGRGVTSPHPLAFLAGGKSFSENWPLSDSGGTVCTLGWPSVKIRLRTGRDKEDMEEK